jgi:HSP20 family molecular chaperone IbpA
MYHYTPPVDVLSNDQEMLLVADLPGVSPQEISLEVDDRLLTLSAGGNEDTPPRWSRRFTLTPDIDPDQIAAEHRDGVLTVRLPRAPKPARRIAVTLQHLLETLEG